VLKNITELCHDFSLKSGISGILCNPGRHGRAGAVSSCCDRRAVLGLIVPAQLFHSVFNDRLGWLFCLSMSLLDLLSMPDKTPLNRRVSRQDGDGFRYMNTLKAAQVIKGRGAEAYSLFVFHSFP